VLEPLLGTKLETSATAPCNRKNRLLCFWFRLTWLPNVTWLPFSRLQLINVQQHNLYAALLTLN